MYIPAHTDPPAITSDRESPLVTNRAVQLCIVDLRFLEDRSQLSRQSLIWATGKTKDNSLEKERISTVQQNITEAFNGWDPAKISKCIGVGSEPMPIISTVIEFRMKKTSPLYSDQLMTRVAFWYLGIYGLILTTVKHFCLLRWWEISWRRIASLHSWIASTGNQVCGHASLGDHANGSGRDHVIDWEDGLFLTLLPLRNLWFVGTEQLTVLYWLA